MTWWEFFYGKLITLGFLWIGYTVFASFLFIIELPVGSILLLTAVFLFLQLLWLSISFIHERKQLQQLHHLMEALPELYLLGEVLPKPKNVTERKYFEALQALSADAIARVERAERATTEYKEYVEAWIHEIKTPLTASALILTNDADIRKLRRELKRADNLTDSILYYARLQSIEKDKHIQPNNMSKLMNAAVQNQMDLLIAANMQVEVEGDFTVYTDSKSVQFILNQLLINSAKYCPNSKITLSAKDGILTYRDNGIGIPAHDIMRVTERGYTGTNGQKLGTSTGMGLYIVAKLCAELHIDLAITSEEGKYTCFQLTFPNLTKT